MKSVFILFSCFILISCSNVFRGLSKQDSDAALYEDALKSMNALDWDTALSKFSSISSDFRSQTRVRENYAGALAGKCGLNFMTYLNRLSTSSPGGSVTFLMWLMNAFTQTSINPSYCRLAENEIRALGATPALRTSGQNLFMIFLSFVKIGTTLRNRADIDSTANLGDGSTDASFNACSSSPTSNPAVLSDTEVQEVITGIALAIENSASLPSGSGIGPDLNSLGALCGAACNKTDTSQITAPEITSMRNLLASTVNTFGVGGQCPSANPAACCP